MRRQPGFKANIVSVEINSSTLFALKKKQLFYVDYLGSDAGQSTIQSEVNKLKASDEQTGKGMLYMILLLQIIGQILILLFMKKNNISISILFIY